MEALMTALSSAPLFLTGMRFRLNATPAAPAAARQRILEALAALGVPAAEEADAVLVASELVTNAVQALPGGTLALCLAFRPSGYLSIEVHDSAPGQPAIRAADNLAEDGRGLALVAALASEWGWHRIPGGKSVYAVVAIGTPA
jgi:anti-sigma regulatory factor (Ser/Thr protein kinase)